MMVLVMTAGGINHPPILAKGRKPARAHASHTALSRLPVPVFLGAGVLAALRQQFSFLRPTSCHANACHQTVEKETYKICNKKEGRIAGPFQP